MSLRPSMVIIFLILLAHGSCGGQEYDLVITNGRVIDPETKLDAIRNVGVIGGRIESVTDQPLEGKETIDAKGHVVAPGFIDLHSHGQDPYAFKLYLRDGDASSRTDPTGDRSAHSQRDSRRITADRDRRY